MPYITNEERLNLTDLTNYIDLATIETEGQLNYLITKLCQRYAKTQERFGYKTVNAIVGALECAKQEYYRRIAAPYEDMKIESNGDVF